ncbi:unnamed protein product [Lampetra fluviatilis]
MACPSAGTPEEEVDEVDPDTRVQSGRVSRIDSMPYVTAPHGGDKMAANRCPLAAVPKDEDGPAPAMTSCTPAESPVAVPSVPSVPGTATS